MVTPRAIHGHTSGGSRSHPVGFVVTPRARFIHTTHYEKTEGLTF